jgi:hypothetical protein
MDFALGSLMIEPAAVISCRHSDSHATAAGLSVTWNTVLNKKAVGGRCLIATSGGKLRISW